MIGIVGPIVKAIAGIILSSSAKSSSSSKKSTDTVSEIFNQIVGADGDKSQGGRGKGQGGGGKGSGCQKN